MTQRPTTTTLCSINDLSIMKKKKITIPLLAKGSTPLFLYGLLIVAVFLIGKLSAQVEFLKKSQGIAAPATRVQSPTDQQAAAGTQSQQRGAIVSLSVDDDPFMGDENAPVVMIEFSDFECPYCKQFWQQTLPEIKRNYIDTGKLKFVYRDLPLPFHDPLATQEALAANCARDQEGDETFFTYHDEIFKRTNSNGNGMPKEELYKIAADLGLNETELRSCLDSERFKDEVTKDIADAQAAGATGTPTLIIGKNTQDGTIQGERVIGAQPYSIFQPVIEKYLE